MDRIIRHLRVKILNRAVKSLGLGAPVIKMQSLLRWKVGGGKASGWVGCGAVRSGVVLCWGMRLGRGDDTFSGWGKIAYLPETFKVMLGT